MIAFQIAGKATRDALFLSSFGVAALPLMVIAAAAVSAAVSVALARLMAQSQPGRVVPRLFALSALLLLAEWALALQSRRPAAILLYLHFTALGALLVSGFWAIVNERFDPRTARRTIGHITAGGSVGSLLGGLLPERVGATLSLLAMLPILATLHLLAAALVVAVEHGAPHRTLTAPHLDSSPGEGAIAIFRASPYLLSLALMVTLTSAAEGLLDYVFKARAAAAAISGEQLLRLFAAFYTVTALLAISVQITTLRKVLDRLGIARSAALLPAGVSVGAVGAFLIPGLVPVLLARGAEVVLRSSLFRAAYEILFTPVSPREKRGTKLLIDVGAARIGDVMGGVLIAGTIVIAGAGTGKVLLGITVALSVGALLVARRLHLGYVEALEGTLQRRAGEIPDPVPDEGSALLQTVGGFDLSGIRKRPQLTAQLGSATGSSPAPAPSRPDKTSTSLREAIASRSKEAVERALSAGPLPPQDLEAAIELLAWDEVAPAAIQTLKGVARRDIGIFVRHLLDSTEDFAIRRRLVTVIAAARTVESFNALFDAMADRRFEVRYRSARALSYLAGEIPGLVIDRERVFEVMMREMAVERSLWETRQLIDQPDDDSSPVEAEVLRGRTNRSLEHLFTLLTLALPRETVRLAFHGLHTGDRYLRGTALEYLETVLPDSVWARLRPFLENDDGRAARSARSSQEAMRELLASQNSIVIALEEVRRRHGSGE
jgi:hypothetical protein